MKEFKFVSKRARYERKIDIITKTLFSMAAVFAAISACSILAGLFCSYIEDIEQFTATACLIGIISFVVASIFLLVAYSFDSKSYDEYVERKNKKWLI